MPRLEVKDLTTGRSTGLHDPVDNPGLQDLIACPEEGRAGGEYTELPGYPTRRRRHVLFYLNR